MPFPETYASDYEEYKAMVEQNNLNGLQALQDSIPRIMDKLQRHLNQLRTTEALLLQRIRRDQKLTVATSNTLDANTNVNPVQSYSNSSRNTFDPADNFTIATNKMQRAANGIIYLIQEKNKLASEIQAINSDINNYNTLLTDVNNKLGTSKIKGSDLNQDKISQSMVVGLMGLLEIALQYDKYTSQPNGTRAFTENVKIVNLTARYKSTFRGMGERHPWVLSGEVVLNFADPGDPSNIKNLTDAIDEVRRKVAIPQKVLEGVGKYGSELKKHLNDPVTSKDVKRDPDPVLDPKSAMSILTNGIANFWGFSKEVNWWSSLVHNTDKAARDSAFFQFVSGTHNNIPVCGKTPSAEQKKKTEASVQSQQSEAEAQKTIQNKLGTATLK